MIFLDFIYIMRICLYKIISLILVVILQGRVTQGYNVEVTKVGLAKGENNSQFGYALGLLNPNSFPYGNNVVMLVGSPNKEVDGIQAYGGVSVCEKLHEEIITCTSLSVTDGGVNRCDNLRASNSSRSHCETDSRLGATIAVNKNFPSLEDKPQDVPRVTICAPGWKNTYPEKNKMKNNMIGMCLKLTSDLKSMSCDTESVKYRKYEFCWPFSPGQFAQVDHVMGGWIIYPYAEAGLSAAFTTDGLNEIIGGPGIYQWRGGIKLVQRNMTYHYSWQEGHTMYGGYAVASGHILNERSENIAVGSPNVYSKSEGYTGRVELLEYRNSNGTRLEKEDFVEIGIKRECDGLTVMDVSRDRQHGAKFGATVAAIDINDDGIDELLVGAPLYSGSYPEEGRVFIYTSKLDKLCGPVSVLSGNAAIMARFGSAIASVGDIDRDGAKDFAIGAPYEDTGVGAVYIYRGNVDCFCNINNKYSQRISGGLYSPNTRGFGWSIYGDHDLDDNGFPDFAVGAYGSDQTIVFRTRPIIDVNMTIKISPKQIPLNISLVNCSKDNTQLCFNMGVIMNFTSVGSHTKTVNEITIELELMADKLFKQKDGYSRMYFRKNGMDTLAENITMQGSREQKYYILDIAMNGDDPEPRDAWTPVLMEVRFRVLPLPVPSFSRLDPILKDSISTIIRKQVQFDKKCGTLDLCTSDLQLNVDLLLKGPGFSKDIVDDIPIYVGEGDRLIVTVDVKNLNDTSYNANFSSTIGAARIGQTLHDQGDVTANCSHTPDFARTWSTCLANSKLDRKENFKVIMEFDISKGKLIPDNNIEKMQQSLMIVVDAKQENRDTNPKNNKFNKTVNILLKYNMRILPNPDISADERYKQNDKSTRMITLVHQYSIRNLGPSYLPKTYVNITIPVRKGSLELARIVGYSSACNAQNTQPIVQTTTKSLPTTSSYVPEPEKQRKRRSAETPRAEAVTSRDQGASKFITCGEYDCITVECLVTNLGSNKETTVNVTIDVFEKALATEKNAREFLYGTNATVTDPVVWFSCKVVPFDSTVYATKWTRLVVDAESVASEVPIWIIIVAVAGAILLLLVVLAILYKFGFFKRSKKHYQIKQMKRESLYNRMSQRMSTMGRRTDNPPYDAMEENIDTGESNTSLN